MISLISALMNSINSTIGTNKEVPLDTMINETNKKVSDLKTRLDNTSSEINEIKTMISGVENIDNDIICDLYNISSQGFVYVRQDNHYEKEITYVAKDNGIIIFNSAIIGNLIVMYKINDSNEKSFNFDNNGGSNHNTFINQKQSINISKDDIIKIKLKTESLSLIIGIFTIRTLYNIKNASLLSKSIKRVSYGSGSVSRSGSNSIFYHHNVDIDKSLIILNGTYKYMDNDRVANYQPILISRTNNKFIINNNMYDTYRVSGNGGDIAGGLSWQLIEFY